MFCKYDSGEPTSKSTSLDFEYLELRNGQTVKVKQEVKPMETEGGLRGTQGETQEN